jgi:hypothetical protein
MGIETFENVVSAPIKPRTSVATARHASVGAQHLRRFRRLACNDLRETR